MPRKGSALRMRYRPEARVLPGVAGLTSSTIPQPPSRSTPRASTCSARTATKCTSRPRSVGRIRQRTGTPSMLRVPCWARPSASRNMPKAPSISSWWNSAFRSKRSCRPFSSACTASSLTGPGFTNRPIIRPSSKPISTSEAKKRRRRRGRGSLGAVECSPSSVLVTRMFHVILFRPEIPPNTGNIIRLCANAGCSLHLIEPLGFELDDKRLRRAGLDYHEYAPLKRHADLNSCLASLGHPRLFGFTTKGSQPFHEVAFQRGDAFLFGPESRGLPAEIRDALPNERRLRLPMRPDSRSLNLSNTVAVAVYEAWRQLGFAMD